MVKKLDKKIEKYYKIIEPNFPSWLYEYINTPEMLHLQHISVSCGAIYSNLFKENYFYSSLDHSIAVALIIWHFTHDKKQTISGLFHDIATPVFKHCVDFLNGDYMTQESTEELTTNIIKNSKEITKLLKKDKIKIEEIDNYHLYPIADNNTPQLSADRLEYSLSNGLLIYNLIDYEKVKEIYNDIEILKNENNELELGFKTKSVAIDFVKITSQLSILYREDKIRYSMQFLADILKKLNEDNIITKKDLYILKEKEIISIIENSKYKKVFKKWKNSKRIKTSYIKPQNVYYVNHPAKIRYINPLCNEKRISEISKIAKNNIEKNLSYKMDKYIYLNLKF